MKFGYLSSGYYHFPILIHSTPQILLLAIDFHEDLIEVERIAITRVSPSKTASVSNTELNTPESDDFGWESVTLVGIHHPIINRRRLSCQYP
jgi:hypothetical protein